MKRIFLFLATNLAVMITLSVVASLLGVNRYITAQGLDFGALLGFAAVFGFGGALISLAMSKWSAKMATGAQIIETPRTAEERWLVETVQRQAAAAGIGMPDVAIFPSPEVNAFATGMSKNNALVAVSAGLLQRMRARKAERRAKERRVAANPSPAPAPPCTGTQAHLSGQYFFNGIVAVFKF